MSSMCPARRVTHIMMVFSDKFGDEEAVVRVHVFDPFLFTKEFMLDSLSCKIHFEKG